MIKEGVCFAPSHVSYGARWLIGYILEEASMPQKIGCASINLVIEVYMYLAKYLFLCTLFLNLVAIAETTVYPHHPRLLFRDTDLADLKLKCQMPLYAPLYQAMKSWANKVIENNSNEGDMTIFGFLYQLEGDESYLKEAKKRLLKASSYEMQFLKPTFEMKYTYDLIYIMA